MKTSPFAKTLSAALLIAATGISMNSLADNLGETVVRTSTDGLRVTNVSYDDLDLSSKQGRQTLHFRIGSAARLVCGDTDIRKTGSLKRAQENKSCYDNSVAQAKAQISSELVASISQ